MGIGGIDEDGSNLGNDEYEEVSGLWGGQTLDGQCPFDDFCEPDGYREFGGTSAATANVAGVAGLVRSFYPSFDAPTVRSRLKQTAGADFSGVANAEKAILLSAVIDGPTRVPPNSTCEWNADVTGGNPPYAYEWRKDGVQVGTNSSVSIEVGSSGFSLRLDVDDVDGRAVVDEISVTIDSNSAPPECAA